MLSLLIEVGDFTAPLVLPVGETGLVFSSLLIREVEFPFDPISSWANGTLVSLVSLENTPFFGSHWKYLIPPTEPSFLPEM